MSGLIESETRAPGLPQPQPKHDPSPCRQMLDELVPKTLTDGWLRSVAAAAERSPAELRSMVEYLVRWACIDAYYAGKADERAESRLEHLQQLTNLERAIRGGQS